VRLSYRLRLVIVFSSVIGAGVLGFYGKTFFVPESFGLYGHYRGDSIREEALRDIRHGTSASCLTCHAHEALLHLKGKHATISCEFCHGTYADHVSGNKKIGALPVKKDEAITTLCLRCHNRAIQARPEEVIKTVTMPEHLEKQKVKPTHTCNQCHLVHAPMEYINRARQITGMMEADNEN
jgi:hypothetical protein